MAHLKGHLDGLKTSDAQNWTAEQLVTFSNSMASAFFVESQESQSADAKNDDWTTEQLIELSNSMGRAFCPGL